MSTLWEQFYDEKHPSGAWDNTSVLTAYARWLEAKLRETRKEAERFQEWPCGHASVVLGGVKFAGCPVCAMKEGTGERIAGLKDQIAEARKDTERMRYLLTRYLRYHDGVAECESDGEPAICTCLCSVCHDTRALIDTAKEPRS